MRDDGLQRLQRVLAAAGFGSRRECETLIEEGRIQVDGEIVNKLGTRVDPETAKIFVDGQKVKKKRPQYFIVNKPPGVVSTSNDPAGRMRVIDLINTDQRVYNVGRLDKSSEGLILVTNDGDLANKLTHPRYRVPKKYMVLVAGHPDRETMSALEDGVYLAEGMARATSARVKKRQKDNSWVEITLEEGRNREIRRLLAKVGHKVLTLRRISIGPISLDDLPVGAHRRLTREELNAVNRFVRNAHRRKPAERKAGRKRTVESLGRKPRSEKAEHSTRKRSSATSERPKRGTSERPTKRRDDKPKRKSSTRKSTKATGRRGEARVQPTRGGPKRSGPKAGRKTGPKKSTAKRGAPKGRRK